MRNSFGFFAIVFLVVLVIFLQVQSGMFQKDSEDILIIRDEISFLQEDISRDSLIVSGYLQVDSSVDYMELDQRRGLLDEECDSRRDYFAQGIGSGLVSHSEGIQTYYGARDSHAELEEIKDFLVRSPQSFDEGILEVYEKKLYEVSDLLEGSNEYLSLRSAEISSRESRNSMFTLGATIMIGFIAIFGIVPRRRRNLTKREEMAISIIRNNQLRNVVTTVKDIKKECDITHPTAQGLIKSLESKKMVSCERKGREKRVFLESF